MVVGRTIGIAEVGSTGCFVGGMPLDRRALPENPSLFADGCARRPGYSGTEGNLRGRSE
jgi:hypothetical protein